MAAAAISNILENPITTKQIVTNEEINKIPNISLVVISSKAAITHVAAETTSKLVNDDNYGGLQTIPCEYIISFNNNVTRADVGLFGPEPVKVEKISENVNETAVAIDQTTNKILECIFSRIKSKD
jgi:hypothetical protein